MKKFLIMLLCATLWWSCAEDAPENLVGTIAGSVADKTTGEFISNVSLSLTPSGRSTATGDNGLYEFKNLSQGEYTVTATKTGYKSSSNTITVSSGKTSECHILIERIPAVITSNRDTLDFGSNYSTNTLSFNIVNENFETLDWEVVNNCGWISEVLPTKGTLEYKKTGTIIVKINRELLSGGENIAILVLRTSGNGSTEVVVKAIGVAKSKAKLNILDATNIEATKATLNGEITSKGYPEYTERGFVYSEQQMPTVDQTIKRITVPVNDNNKFSFQVANLTLGKTYYARAYAVNEVGIAYSSNEISFTTEIATGTVIMKSVDDINLSTHTAIAHAEVTNVGDLAYTERGFVYSNTNSTPTIYNEKITVAGSGKGTFDAKLTNLTRDATYYVRAYIKNEAGIAYSNNVLNFNTKESMPEVKTLEATDINTSNYSAVLQGEIVSAGNPPYTERGFVYSTQYTNPTINDTKVAVSGTGTGKFEKRLDNLSSQYATYVRAYATNSKGTVYGETIVLFQPDFIILHNLGIAIQREDLGEFKWSDANTMCKNSTVGGYTDWRLPTKEELSGIYLLKDEIGGFRAKRYWTSSGGYNGYYYTVNFYDGSSGSWYASDIYYVRAVRTLK